MTMIKKTTHSCPVLITSPRCFWPIPKMFSFPFCSPWRRFLHCYRFLRIHFRNLQILRRNRQILRFSKNDGLNKSFVSSRFFLISFDRAGDVIREENVTTQLRTLDFKYSEENNLSKVCLHIRNFFSFIRA